MYSSGGIHGTFRYSGKHRQRDCPITEGACIAHKHRCASSKKETGQTEKDSRGGYLRASQDRKEEEEKSFTRRPQAHCRGSQAPLGCAKESCFGSCKVANCPLLPDAGLYRARRYLIFPRIAWQTQTPRVNVGGGGIIGGFLSMPNMEVLDVGIPLLSMHATYEMPSKVDLWSYYRFMPAFYTME